MSSNASFISAVKNPCVQIANADATNFKTIMTGAANGSRLDVLSATNGDAANPYVLQLSIQKGGTDYPVGEVTLPAGAGTNGTAKAVNLLNATDLPQLANTLNCLFLEPSASLRAKAKTTVSGVNTIAIVGVGGDY